MPQKTDYKYGGTVTFKQHFDYNDKQRLIKALPDFISEHLPHYKSHDYYLVYTIEYHKVGNEDDYEAPHVHFILYSTGKLSQPYVRGMFNALAHYYGRSQFFLMTQLKFIQYRQYIEKDVNKNDKKLNRPHHYELQLNKPNSISRRVLLEVEENDYEPYEDY